MNALATSLAAAAIALLGVSGPIRAATTAAAPAPAQVAAKTPASAATPAARKIPGINVADPYPKACIDCHVNKPPTDARLGPLMQQWMAGKVNPALLATVQGSAPAGLKLKGKHPDATDALEDIPAACAECHTDDSKKAPPLAGMVHRIHLVGGDKNHFVTDYQGECTYCHKLNAATGAWSVPSGPEKK
jgi:mono/diheme cytochrome c family protein